MKIPKKLFRRFVISVVVMSVAFTFVVVNAISLPVSASKHEQTKVIAFGNTQPSPANATKSATAQTNRFLKKHPDAKIISSTSSIDSSYRTTYTVLVQYAE